MGKRENEREREKENNRGGFKFNCRRRADGRISGGLIRVGKVEKWACVSNFSKVSGVIRGQKAGDESAGECMWVE